MTAGDVDGPGVVPLTWAQQYFVLGPPALDETCAWRHDVVFSVALPNDTDADRMLAAVRRLLRRFPPLRARLCRTADGELTQEILAEDDPGLLAGAQRWSVPSYLPGGGPPSVQLGKHVARLPTLDGVPNLVVLVPPTTASRANCAVAHGFVDAAGSVAAAAALDEELRSPGRRPVQPTLYRMLAFEQSAAGRALSARNIEHLVTAARAGDEFGPRPVPHGKTDVPALRTSSRSLFRFLAIAGGGSRLSRAATMIALGLVGYAIASGRDGALLAVPVSNRTGPDYAFVGLAMTSGWLAAGLRPQDSFRELVRAMAARLTDCSQRSRFSPSEAMAEIARLDLRDTPDMYFNYWEEHGTDWRSPQSPDDRHNDLEPTEFERTMLPAGGVGAPFELNVYAAHHRTIVVLKYDDVTMSGADVDRFLAALPTLTTAVTANPDVPVGTLLNQ